MNEGRGGVPLKCSRKGFQRQSGLIKSESEREKPESCEAKREPRVAPNISEIFRSARLELVGDRCLSTIPTFGMAKLFIFQQLPRWKNRRGCSAPRWWSSFLPWRVRNIGWPVHCEFLKLVVFCGIRFFCYRNVKEIR